jgi:hypothetical protein
MVMAGPTIESMTGGVHKIKNKISSLSSKSEPLKLNQTVFLILWQNPAITVIAADSDPPKPYTMLEFESRTS